MTGADTTATQRPGRGVLRIGTRGSELATTQAGHVRDAIVALGQPAELVIIHTRGDADRVSPVERLGVGVFTQALREALGAGQCDVAVHSFKDLPTAPADGVVLAAVPPRVDARDTLVTRQGHTLAALPSGATVGTSAPRRVAQLRRSRPDLDIRPLRGNIDTRLGRVDDGELDAVILARAGLDRTGRVAGSTVTLDPEVLLPAPAQGALAVECRAADADIVALLGRIDDATSHHRAVAERMVLEVLQAGCTAPVAAHSAVSPSPVSHSPAAPAPAGSHAGTTLRLTAGVFALDGTRHLIEEISGQVTGSDDARVLGRLAAEKLLDRGAHEVMGDTLR